VFATLGGLERFTTSRFLRGIRLRRFALLGKPNGRQRRSVFASLTPRAAKSLSSLNPTFGRARASAGPIESRGIPESWLRTIEANRHCPGRKRLPGRVHLIEEFIETLTGNVGKDLAHGAADKIPVSCSFR
jgi:hypothetical protein